jgi:hypothetical protein
VDSSSGDGILVPVAITGLSEGSLTSGRCRRGTQLGFGKSLCVLFAGCTTSSPEPSAGMTTQSEFACADAKYPTRRAAVSMVLRLDIEFTPYYKIQSQGEMSRRNCREEIPGIDSCRFRNNHRMVTPPMWE